MRPMTEPAPSVAAPAASPSAPLTRGQPLGELKRFQLTLPFAGLAVYLWVIHSAKLPIASYAIALGLFGLLLQAQPLRFPVPLACFGGFFLWALITSPSAQHPAATWDSLVDYGKLWLVFLLTCNVARSRRQLQALMITWLGIFALYPVRGTMFNFALGIGEFGRYAWNFFFSNPNDLAALTLPILAMSIAVLQGEKHKKRFRDGGWVRMSALAGVMVLPALIFVTQSRGGILALVTMALLVLVQYRRQARSLAIGVLVAGVVALSAPAAVWTRLGGLAKAGDTSTLQQVDTEGSADQRFEIWRVAAAIIADNPVTGVGLGGYPQSHVEYAQASRFAPVARGTRDTHSIYLNVMAETGVVGLALLIAMLASVLWQGWTTVKQLRISDPDAAKQVHTLLIGLIAFMQAGIFASLHRVAFLYVYLGVLTTAIAVLGSQPAFAAPARQLVKKPGRGGGGRATAPSPRRQAPSSGHSRPSVRFPAR